MSTCDTPIDLAGYGRDLVPAELGPCLGSTMGVLWLQQPVAPDGWLVALSCLAVTACRGATPGPAAGRASMGTWEGTETEDQSPLPHPQDRHSVLQTLLYVPLLCSLLHSSKCSVQVVLPSYCVYCGALWGAWPLPVLAQRLSQLQPPMGLAPGVGAGCWGQGVVALCAADLGCWVQGCLVQSQGLGPGAVVMVVVYAEDGRVAWASEQAAGQSLVLLCSLVCWKSKLLCCHGRCCGPRRRCGGSRARDGPGCGLLSVPAARSRRVQVSGA